MESNLEELKEDLTKENMIIPKDNLELTNVVGQGILILLIAPKGELPGY